jgi:Lipocalin-like domain
MNQRSIFTLSAIAALGIALLPGSIVAQQGTIKQQLVGTWTPVSQSNPVTVPIVGTNPTGLLMMDAGGRYVQMLRRSDRPKSASASEGIIANFGTWSVSEADRTLTIHRDDALNANIEGTDLKVSVTLTGDELKLTGTTATGVSTDLVYPRAR